MFHNICPLSHHKEYLISHCISCSCNSVKHLLWCLLLSCCYFVAVEWTIQRTLRNKCLQYLHYLYCRFELDFTVFWNPNQQMGLDKAVLVNKMSTWVHLHACWYVLCVLYVCLYFQSAVKWVILPSSLRTESNDVEWKRFIEVLSPPLTPSLTLFLSFCLKLYFFVPPPTSSMSPSLFLWWHYYLALPPITVQVGAE